MNTLCQIRHKTLALTRDHLPTSHSFRGLETRRIRLRESGLEVGVQKSIPTQIRQPMHHASNSEGNS